MLRQALDLSISTPKALKSENAAQTQIQQLETLLCERAKTGEDVDSVVRALEYFKSNDSEQYWHNTFRKKYQERSTFESLQRVIITSFAALGMIVVLDRVFNAPTTTSNANPPSIQKLN